MMKLSHRALITSLLLTIFLVILIGKIDGKSTWSWAVILMPIWVLDLLTFLLIHAKRQSDIYYSFNPLVYYCLAAKIAFQLLLVIRLDIYEAIPIYVILAPLWCLLFMVSTNLFQTIINEIN